MSSTAAPTTRPVSDGPVRLGSVLCRRFGKSLDALTIEERRELDVASLVDQQRREAESERDRRIQNWGRVAEKVGRRYATCNFSNFEICLTDPEIAQRQADAMMRCRDYCADIKDRVAAGVGVILFGTTGTGKDHLLTAMMLGACRAGFQVDWHNGERLMRELWDARFDEHRSASFIESIARPKVLAISDILPWAGELSQDESRFVGEILDVRYRALKPTWLTLNVANREELDRRLGPIVTRRFVDEAMSIGCMWPKWKAKEA